MTPKEKADELLIKFTSSESQDGYNDVRDIHAGIRCALISVYQLIETIETLEDSYWQSGTLEYWNEVKQELNKL